MTKQIIRVMGNSCGDITRNEDGKNQKTSGVCIFGSPKTAANYGRCDVSITLRERFSGMSAKTEFILCLLLVHQGLNF